MFVVNWQYIGKDNKLKSETLYEASTVRLKENPLDLEIITNGWGTFHVTPHHEFHQRVYVMNDTGKTVRTYEVGKLPSSDKES